MTQTIGNHMLLDNTLKSLKLTNLTKTYPECARAASESGSSYEDFLFELLEAEKERREANLQVRRTSEAKFPCLKPLEKTDFDKWSGIDISQIKRLTNCNYIEDKENIVILGKHGTGKSHAATMLGIEACRKSHRVLFITAADLVNNL